jgi:hypothetical protein
MKPRLKILWYNLVAMAIFLGCFSGCSMLYEKRRIPDCRLVFGEIKQYWGKNPATGLHHIRSGATSEYGFGSFRNDACFTGLSQKEIERLFGKPDIQTSERMVYYMNAPCLGSEGTSTDGCHFLSCIFKPDGGLKSIGLVYTMVHIDYIDPGLNPEKEKH